MLNPENTTRLKDGKESFINKSPGVPTPRLHRNYFYNIKTVNERRLGSTCLLIPHFIQQFQETEFTPKAKKRLQLKDLVNRIAAFNKNE